MPNDTPYLNPAIYDLALDKAIAKLTPDPAARAALKGQLLEAAGLDYAETLEEHRPFGATPTEPAEPRQDAPRCPVAARHMLDVAIIDEALAQACARLAEGSEHDGRWWRSYLVAIANAYRARAEGHAIADTPPALEGRQGTAHPAAEPQLDLEGTTLVGVRYRPEEGRPFGGWFNLEIDTPAIARLHPRNFALLLSTLRDAFWQVRPLNTPMEYPLGPGLLHQLHAMALSYQVDLPECQVRFRIERREAAKSDRDVWTIVTGEHTVLTKDGDFEVEPYPVMWDALWKDRTRFELPEEAIAFLQEWWKQAPQWVEVVGCGKAIKVRA